MRSIAPHGVTLTGGLPTWLLAAVLVVAPADAATQRPVASNPRWSPDGAEVIFYAGSGDQTDLYTMRVADGRVIQLTSGTESDYGPDYSPDGRWIVFYSGSDSTYAIVLMRPDGTERRTIRCGGTYEGNPHFSPDGTRIAFFSGPDYDHFEIHIVDLESGVVREVTHEPVTGTNPAWWPDGTVLLFGASHDGRDELMIVQPDGHGLRPFPAG